MSLLERLAEDLARDTLALASVNDKVVDDISTMIGDTSTTLQEAYLTAIRVFRAESRAREFLAELSDKAAARSATASASKPQS